MTGEWVFPPAPASWLPVTDGRRFAVRRIFCIGKNYADHVKEMGGDPKSDPPVFFTKPADAVVHSGSEVPYPQGTEDLHYEAELVIALGAGGFNLTSCADAGALVFGHAAGCDLTRRDLQAAAKKRGAPWDAAKALDNGAPVGTIVPVAELPPSRFDDASLRMLVNGTLRQEAPLSSMIWTVPEIIMELSKLFELKAGDLIYTGTPSGVGPLAPGDRVSVEVGEAPRLEFSIGPRR